MHLNEIGLLQIVFLNYDVSSQKIFSRWSVQLFDESPLFGTDDVFIGSHVSYTIIDWLMHNNARDEIKLRFISFFSCFCRSYCRSLSFMAFVLSFTAIRIAVFVVCIAVLYCSLPFVLLFFIVFNRLLAIIFFCHLSIAVLWLPVPIGSIE